MICRSTHRFIHNYIQDYFLLERDLAATYAPQNTYCFALDSDSSAGFQKRIHDLASCFPDNVMVAKQMFDMDSAGHNQVNSLMQCLKLIVKRDWKYLLNLQNHEMSLRTPRELVQIFQWLDGANDVTTMVWLRKRPAEAINADWSFKGLNLFKDCKHLMVDTC